MALRRKIQLFVYRKTPAFQVLLLKRAKTDKGDWHPVTGNVEAHEPILAAAVREAFEEVSLELSPQPLGVTFTYEHNGKRFHETAFAAPLPKDGAAIELSEEHTAYEWLPPEEALARLSWPEQKRALEALIARFA